MKKLVRILLLLPASYLIIMPAYFATTASSRICSDVEITVRDSSDYNFITKREILNLINGTGGRVYGRSVKEVSAADIENRLKNLRELKVAEVYLTLDGTLRVYTDQRDPIMRVIPNNGGDFYIDEEGIVVRRRNLYTPRLHIVGGNINISSAMLSGVSVLDTAIKNSILKDIYHLVKYIRNDNFWSAQIDQIYVDSNDEIDLVPRVGNHMIHLGTAENVDGKLRNLATFYEKVLPEVGWNKYSKINLAFKDQIVCKKR